ncbi:MAG: sulfotransferase family protein [Methylococcales bacterium]
MLVNWNCWFLLSPIEFGRQCLSSVLSTARYVLLCSAARSGSSLLDMLLGSHSLVESLGEFSFLGKAIARNEACSCGLRIRECRNWQRVFDRVREEKGIDLLEAPYAMRQWDTYMDNSNADFNQQTRTYSLRRKVRKVRTLVHFSSPVFSRLVPLSPQLRQGVENAIYLYEVIRSIGQATVIVDSSKEVFKAVSVYLRCPEAVRVVLLTRDGRGAMYSRLYSGVWTGESPEYAVRRWKNYYESALRMIGAWVDPLHVYRLSYEELVRDPDLVVARLHEWLGLSVNSQAASKSKKVLHIAGGNDGTKSRFRSGVKSDERWKTGLGRGELALFESRAGELNRRLGYPV